MNSLKLLSKSLSFTVNEIHHHPLTAEHKVSAWKKWLAWQIGSRLVPGPVLMPFVNQTKLLVQPGLWGATMNIYTGLAEFYDMAFMLHFLRPSDIFVDVGANVGVYTVLASGAVGCQTIAFEPGQAAGDVLLTNCKLNEISSLVHFFSCAVGDKNETVKFTKGLDTTNHVVDPKTVSTVVTYQEVEMVTLDATVLASNSVLIKIDVEGFTAPVLRGASNLLQQTSLKAIIAEVVNLKPFENFDEKNSDADLQEVFCLMSDCGFRPYSYDPYARRLTEIQEQVWTDTLWNQSALEYNYIFLRDAEFAQKRVAEAEKFSVWNYQI